MSSADFRSTHTISACITALYTQPGLILKGYPRKDCEIFSLKYSYIGFRLGKCLGWRMTFNSETLKNVGASAEQV